MLVHKGGKIKNWGGECRDVTPTKLQSQNIFKESTGGIGLGVRMDVNEEFFVKIKKDFFFFFGGGGRVGVGVFGGSQGGCEQRIEVFVKIKKKKIGGGGRGGRAGSGGGGSG